MGINNLKTTFIIADDHDVVRAGLATLLTSRKEMEVIGEAEDGVRAVIAVDFHRPDFLIVDNQMPLHNGIEVAKQLKERGLPTKIIMLTMHGHEAYVRNAFKAGIAGYVLKEQVSVEIFEAIKVAKQGGKYLSPRLGSQVTIANLLHEEESVEVDPLSYLTDRERTVFHGVVRGRTNPEIAEALSLSPRTIETHRTNMMSKLGVPTKDRLVTFAIAKKLVEIDEDGYILGEPPSEISNK